MKVILNESRFNTIFSDWLDKSGIDINIGWYGVGRINGYDERIISGFVQIKEDESILFNRRYSYKYKDSELSLYEIYPDINRFGFGGIFKIFPTDLVAEYFSELIKDYIYMKLETR
jgi:hypothetical protein